MKNKTENKFEGVHLRHCYQGEYEDSCKYGEEDCPAKKEREKKIIATFIVFYEDRYEHAECEDCCQARVIQLKGAYSSHQEAVGAI